MDLTDREADALMREPLKINLGAPSVRVIQDQDRDSAMARVQEAIIRAGRLCGS